MKALTPWYATPLGRSILDSAPARRPRDFSARMYEAANYNRLSSDWTPIGTSADSEIVTSLRLLRNRSRQVVRDNEYAKNAVRIVQNNVVGTGIRMQATVETIRAKRHSINDDIEDAFCEWWEDRNVVHTGGTLAGPDLERVIVGNLVENGEAILRIHRRPFGNSTVPLALELLEADRLMDQWSTARSDTGNAIRMGVEVDDFQRPVAYWFYPTHPGDYQFASFQPSKFIRIPANDILHIYVADRFPQSRGVPWFHSALSRINNMKGYEEAEIVAARMSAAIMGFIKSPEPLASEDVVDGQRVMDMSPGEIRHLLPGEDFQGFNPSRPNAGLAPFMRAMLRAVAAGVGMSYESLSRDYSQSNYSSSRLALLDDRDLWRVLQGWIIRTMRVPIHAEFMKAAVIAGTIKATDYYTNPKKYCKAVFKPRGWSWIDPYKEVQAYRDAVRAGFMTVTDVIGLTGGGADAEDVFKTRREELDMMAELDLVFDTDSAQVNEKGIAQPNTAPEEEVGAPAAAGEAAESESSNDNPPASAGK